MEESLKYVCSVCFPYSARSNQSTLENTDMVLALSSLSLGFKRALAIASDAQEEKERKGN